MPMKTGTVTKAEILAVISDYAAGKANYYSHCPGSLLTERLTGHQIREYVTKIDTALGQHHMPLAAGSPDEAIAAGRWLTALSRFYEGRAHSRRKVWGYNESSSLAAIETLKFVEERFPDKLQYYFPGSY